MLLVAIIGLAVLVSLWIVLKWIIGPEKASSLSRGIGTTFKVMMVICSLGFLGLLLYAYVASS